MKTVGKRKNLFLLFTRLMILCLLIFGMNPIKAAAGEQYDFYYYSSGRKIPLELSQKTITVQFKEGTSLEQQKAVVESEKNLKSFDERIKISDKFILSLQEETAKSEVLVTIGMLNTKPEVAAAYPAFSYPRYEAILTDEFLVKFRPSVSRAEIDAFNGQHGVEIIRGPKKRGSYTLRVKNPKYMNTLELANLYYENSITKYSVPNFMLTGELYQTVSPNDTYYDSDDQWPLHNFGQDPPDGTSGADINAPEAWELTTGSSDITIAIIDTGVEGTHPDLNDLIVAGKDFWNDGYPEDDNDPTPKYCTDDAHGTVMAGLAAAVTDNNEGIAGVTWNCKIMPVRIAGDIAGPEERCLQVVIYAENAADGIEWAADNGADVLNNSWGGPSNADIDEAITHAKTYGRDGKGCVIVCAAGNSDGGVGWPASLSITIAVGATDCNDERWDVGVSGGSNYGDELNVMAPSAWGIEPGVTSWSTDTLGNRGYNDEWYDYGDPRGDYYKYAGGTSSATAIVSGVAALVLSVDADLTSDQVQGILQCTADDKGSSGWDEYYGWGRINAHRACQTALNYPGGFCVKDSDGNSVALFDNLGNLFLKGELEENSDHSATGHDEFRLKDSGGSDVVIINTAIHPEMFIDGTLSQRQTSLSPSGANDNFVIKNADGTVVSYIDDSGNLYLKGQLFENTQ